MIISNNLAVHPQLLEDRLVEVRSEICQLAEGEELWLLVFKSFWLWLRNRIGL